MTTITATSILASRHANDLSKRVDTLLLRYPRCIHSEFMTHRVFGRNASSSRAIPVDKLIKAVVDDPFVPLFWGKNQKGMQATEEMSEREIRDAKVIWEQAMNAALIHAKRLAGVGAHKQIVNRVYEPYAHITVVVTGTQWSNFLALRDHPAAEPHIAMLAREVRKAIDGAYVQTLQPGQWHLPFVEPVNSLDEPVYDLNGEALSNAIKLSVARCASTSYKTIEGFDMTLERAIALHDKLVASVPLHASPCEHQAKADEPWQVDEMCEPRWANPELGGNLGAGWVQYRKTLPGECQ
jgi:hypothetical protein